MSGGTRTIILQNYPMRCALSTSEYKIILKRKDPSKDFNFVCFSKVGGCKQTKVIIYFLLSEAVFYSFPLNRQSLNNKHLMRLRHPPPYSPRFNSDGEIPGICLKISSFADISSYHPFSFPSLGDIS